MAVVPHKNRFALLLGCLPLLLLAAQGSRAAEEPHTLLSQPRLQGLELLDLRLSLGYRQDDFDWSFAGNSAGGNPNILSELSWEEVEIYQIETRGSLLFKNFYLRGNFAYGTVEDGDVQDADYDQDNRRGEWSRSLSRSKDGEVMDLSLGAGYLLFKHTNEAWLTGYLVPVVGYSFSSQDLTLKDGTQTVAGVSSRSGDVSAPLGPIANLNSTYETAWKGPWFGVDYFGQVTRDWELSATAEYHWLEYDGKGDWNLRQDFQHPTSFEHLSTGSGYNLEGSVAHHLNARWMLTGVMQYRNWSAEGGVNRQFLANGTTAESRLHEVNWDSYALMLGARYGF